MKDNIIKLSEGAKCYVMDELDYKSKKYIYCIEVDEDGEFIEDSIFTREIGLDDNTLIIKPIEDFEIASVVNNLFLARTIEQ